MFNIATADIIERALSGKGPINPVRAHMVAHPKDYSWSSVNANAFGRLDAFLSLHSALLALGMDRGSRLRNYRALLGEPVNENQISKIRAHINQGKALGSTTF
jgi:putative transposase